MIVGVLLTIRHFWRHIINDIMNHPNIYIFRNFCVSGGCNGFRKDKGGEKLAESEVIGLPLSQYAEKEHSSSTTPTAPTRLIHCTLVVKSFLSEKLFQPIMSELCNSAKSRNLRLQCIQVRLRSAKLMRALFCPTGTNSRYTLHRLREISIL